ncbi:hypothetical protein F5B22DRAFT_630238 [Xylaria bambusicola]|uniref:uncharacterized protein n=1 Tax=Xylaria bambusicola TaxID=326684 RepID=UPI0020077E16|nr:uncharacterized protein F5B22DRAFT_630238 [Xylaria bambusicola]KAI0503180.1 hypothetical protein F5B22DRAFT_630238 [Xylaria bambusicola]
MSNSAPTASPDITCLTPEPFVPKPLIADILRTRYCVPDSIFLVEGVDVFHTSKSKRWRAIRLLLGDGELCIQALMAPETHRFVDRGEVVLGVYIKLEKFRFECQDIENKETTFSPGKESEVEHSDEMGAEESDEEEKRKKNKPRQMVYLIVDSLDIVGWHNALIESSMDDEVEVDTDVVEPENVAHEESPKPEKAQQSQQTVMAQPDSPQEARERDLWERVERDTALREKSEREFKEREAKEREAKETEAARQREAEAAKLDSQPADADDDFEVMRISNDQTTQKREAAAAAAAAAATATVTVTTATTSTNRTKDTARPPQPSYNHIQPLKLTKLRSIPNLPYKQNWSVNVLCVISAISDVEPAGIPPYTQRQARLTDPSTDKHVLLTVFLDAHLFTPKVGSIVLLVGVKNHRFDGGSLKKYDSDRPKAGGSWWFENPGHLPWCDVAGLSLWWDAFGA